MIGLSKVLVVDESKTSRETICSVLSAHCDQVIEATGISDAHRALESESDISLVLCEACLRDGDAGDLLLDVATLSGARPPVVVVSTRPDENESKRMVELGATAYLAKPISFLDLSRALKSSRQKLPKAAARIHRQALGTALVLDDIGSTEGRRDVVSHMVWDIQDISVSGAFLETRGPVERGRELSLGIVLGGQMLRVLARVIRLQEPSWGHVAGIGVAFLEFEEGAQQQLKDFIAAHARR